MLHYYYQLVLFLTGVLAVFLGLFIYTRNIRDRRYATYGLFCLSLAVWSFGYGFMLLSTTEKAALFWARTLNAAALFIPVTSYHHIVQLIAISDRFRSRLIKIGYTLSIGLFLLSPTSLLISGVSPKLDFAYWPNPGPLFLVHSLMFTFYACCVVVDLNRATKTAVGRRRNHLKILLFSIVLAYLGGGTNHPLLYDIPVPPVGNIFIPVYIVTFAYCIMVERLLDIEVIIKRSLIYAFLLLGLLIPCYLLVVLGQMITFGNIDYSFSLFTLILFMVVGFIFPKLRFRTEERLERVLFKKRYDYRHTLLKSSRDMISVVDLDSLSKGIVNTVSKALGTDKACLFLFDEIKGAFGIKTCVGLEAGPLRETLLTKDDPLVRRLTQKSDIVVREEIEVNQNGQGWEHPVAMRMAQLEAEVSLPLRSQEGLIGILNLGYRAGKAMYSVEDFDALSTLANQAAIAIENARLYDNLKQSQKIIMRTDRLSSLGMLTAGLAHEIRNPLVAIRTFTQLLPERYTDPEFRESFQSLALKEVDRICGLVNDLLSFARPSVPNVAAENVNEIVENIVRILETQAKAKGIQIYRSLATDLPKIFIDKEQIKQVSMNIILNALQSIEGEGVVEVSTRLFTKSGSEQFVQIEVRDTGVGIPERDLDNIFNPFFTSKEGGSGLGLSISHQIVQEHGGYIVVESQVDAGTTFYINLPVKEPDLRGKKSPIIHEKDLGG